MRLMIVSSTNESRIKKLFEETKYFTVSSQPNLHLISHKENDVLVVMENTIPFNTFLERLVYLDGANKQFYVMNQENLEIHDLCIAKGVIPIVARDEDDMVTQVTETFYPKNPKANRMFLFMGADHKVGTTTIVHSLAHQLASHVSKKVLVISLSNKPNDEFVEVSKSTVDHLRTSISSKVVTFTEIYRESEPVKNYRFLAGPRDIAGYRRYTVEEIVNLLEVLRNQEEYLVLIDGGSDIDNPLIMAALHRVSNKFMVIANRKSHYKAMDQKISQVLKPAFSIAHSSFLFLMNQYDEDIETAKQIHQRGGICAATIPISKYGLSAEEQEIPLGILDDGVRSQIFLLTKIIATKADCEMFEEPVKESKIKRFFSVVRGGEKTEFST